MAPTSDNGSPFPGFRSPNYTMVPDELFDELLPALSGSELKVLLYIIRRTFGFKKDADNISISQMLQGITTKDGRVLDRGVGIKDKKTLLAAIKSLEEQNIILTERRRSAEKGDEPTTYRLNVLSNTAGKMPPPVAEKSPQGGSRDSPPPLVAGKSPQGGRRENPPTPVAEESPQGGRRENPPSPVAGKSPQGGGREFPSPPWRENPPSQETVLQNTEQQQTEDVVVVGPSVFQEHDQKRSGLRRLAPDPGTIAILTEQGIAETIARQLAGQYHHDYILQKIDYLKFLLETEASKVTRPKGWLRRAIEEDYGPPDGYKPVAERHAAASMQAQKHQDLRQLFTSGPTRQAPISWQAWLIEAGAVSESLQMLTVKLQEALAQQLTQATFNAWVATLLITELSDEQVAIAVPSPQAFAWLENRLKKRFEESLMYITGVHRPITFTVMAQPEEGFSGFAQQSPIRSE